MNSSSALPKCVVFVLASLVAACDPEMPEASTPVAFAPTNASMPSTEPKPPPAFAPAAAPSPAPTVAARPAPPPKPKSLATIGGASISDVAGLSVVTEMKKAGWVDLAVALSKESAGAYESVRFDLKKGKDRGHCEIVRPLENPSAERGGLLSPRDQKPDRDREGATYFDEASDVLVIVVVDGNPKQAKKLIDGLVKSPTPTKAAASKKGS